VKGCFLLVCKKEGVWHFAVDTHFSFPEESLSSQSLDKWAAQAGLIRHTAYDSVFYPRTLSVRPFLFEAPSPVSHILLPSGLSASLEWFSFPQLLQKLSLQIPGSRNFLQLAVQYLAAGAVVDQSVIAAPHEEL